MWLWASESSESLGFVYLFVFQWWWVFWIKKTPFLSQGYEEQIRSHIPRYEQESPVNTAPIPSAAEAAVYFIQQFTPELLKLSQVDSLGDVSSHKPTDPRTERNKVETHPQKKYRVSESFSKNVSCDSQYLHRIFILTAFNHRYNTNKCGVSSWKCQCPPNTIWRSRSRIQPYIFQKV